MSEKMKYCEEHQLHYAQDGACFHCLVSEYTAKAKALNEAKQAENAK